VTMPVWLRGTLLLALTFTAGVATGVGYERRRMPAHEAARMDSRHVLLRLKQHLDLDSAQQQAIAAILARRQGTVDSTWHALQPHVDAALDSTLREVLRVLRPDQAAKHRKMMEARHPRTPRPGSGEP
jgi:hypothetical protein